MAEITIYDLDHDEGLIVEAEGGTTYTNQTGGVCCNHPTAVGYWVPLWVPRAIQHICYDSSYLTAEEEEGVEKLLPTFLPGATVNREETNEEAWVHLILPGDQRAILTWENSD